MFQKRSLYVTVDRNNGLSKILTSIMKKLIKRVIACQYKNSLKELLRASIHALSNKALNLYLKIQ